MRFPFRHTQGKSEDDPSTFGIYKSKLMAVQKTEMGKRETTGLTFEEPPKAVFNVLNSDNEIDQYLIEFWGEGLPKESYTFLESELARYKRTHKCDTATEESLLRQICFAELDIRTARAEERSPDSAIKRLMDLMKTASVDPAKASIASGGASMDALGVWIRDIERYEPAEWVENKNLYYDVSNTEKYFQDFFVRPLRNFATGSRLFEIDEDDDGINDSEVLDLGDIGGDLEDGNKPTALPE